MLQVALLFVALTDLAATSRAGAMAFAEPEWVAGMTNGFTGTNVFQFALYRDGNAVYRDTTGNLAYVRLDEAARRVLLGDLPLQQLERLPPFSVAMKGDDCSSYWLVHWKNGVRRFITVESCDRLRLPLAFRVTYERFRQFRSPTATTLTPARFMVVFTPSGPPPAKPLPAGWPATLPALTPAASQFTVVVDQSHLPALRLYTDRLDPTLWQWTQGPITPPPPREEMWTR